MLHLAAPNFVMGLGFGYAASPAIIAAQSSVGWQQRGVATSATLFARSVGSAVGVAAFGAIANTVVRSRLGRADRPRVDAAGGPRAGHPCGVRRVLRGGCCLVVAAAFMPRHVDEVTG